MTVAAVLALNSAESHADWEPTFVDNFDGSELDARSWSSGRQILPRRIHYYDADALDVSNGKLNIKVLNRAESDRPYTTGAVTTQGIFRQQYGYFEIRARIPSGNGFWPAFWLMPETGVWSSEIDIAEFRGQLPDSVHYAFHYGNRLRNENGLTKSLPVDLSQSYNNFAVSWTPERIDYLFNGEIMHSVTDPAVVSNASSRDVPDPESGIVVPAFELDFLRSTQTAILPSRSPSSMCVSMSKYRRAAMRQFPRQPTASPMYAQPDTTTRR